MIRALFVGVDTYGEPNWLRGCENDVEDLAKFVRWLEPDSIVRTLINGDATAIAIRSELEVTIRSARPDDSIFVWFSGCGAQVFEDAESTSRAICPVDFDFYNKETWFTIGDLYEKLSTILDGVGAFVGIDADVGFSDSGRVFRHEDETSQAFHVQTLLQRLRKPTQHPNVPIMFGSRANHPALELSDGWTGRSRGAFTKCFLDAVSSANSRNLPLMILAMSISAKLHQAGLSQIPELAPAAGMMGGSAQGILARTFLESPSKSVLAEPSEALKASSACARRKLELRLDREDAARHVSAMTLKELVELAAEHVRPATSTDATRDIGNEAARERARAAEDIEEHPATERMPEMPGATPSENRTPSEEDMERKLDDAIAFARENPGHGKRLE